MTASYVWGAGGRCRRARRAALAGAPLRGGCSNGARWRASQWLENSAETDVAAPVERCYAMWEDRERIPQWMPWIRTVKVGPCGQAAPCACVILWGGSRRGADQCVAQDRVGRAPAA